MIPSGRRWSTVVQKIIDVAGSSPTSFAKAAENAVATAAETVRNLKWARVAEFEMELYGKKDKTYRATLRIYFDVKRRGAPSRGGCTRPRPNCRCSGSRKTLP